MCEINPFENQNRISGSLYGNDSILHAPATRLANGADKGCGNKGHS